MLHEMIIGPLRKRALLKRDKYIKDYVFELCWVWTLVKETNIKHEWECMSDVEIVHVMCTSNYIYKHMSIHDSKIMLAYID
jgi:hypothetical protein